MHPIFWPHPTYTETVQWWAPGDPGPRHYTKTPWLIGNYWFITWHIAEVVN